MKYNTGMASKRTKELVKNTVMFMQFQELIKNKK